MDSQTLRNLGLVVLFVLVGGVFAATEIALVSLRDSQLTHLERTSARGVKVAAVRATPTASWRPSRSVSPSPGSSPRRTAGRPSRPTSRRTSNAWACPRARPTPPLWS